jgi:hypothetical protein
VYVQHCGDIDQEDQAEEENDWIYGQSAPHLTRWMPMRTARPPPVATMH